jgi:hypothetical protein
MSTETQSDWAPQACTLPTEERPLRAAGFDDLFATSVRGLDRRQPTELRMDLDPAPEVAAQAASLVMKETGCCSFFSFSLVATGGQLRLDITVPETQVSVLDALRSRAAGLAK